MEQFIPPGPGFIATVTAATGILHGAEYDVAQLIITHPGPRRAHETSETIADGMRRLATALRLGPGDQAPPMIGARIAIRHGRATLDYGHDQYVMTIPDPAPDWVQLVAHGALCRIWLMLEPLATAATRAETDAHLRTGLAIGTVRWGTTIARRRF